MDSNPLIKDHILAMASTTSRRPFHFLQDPSIPCPIDHSYPGQPYSAMIHPDRDMITEVFLDKSKKEESANQSSEKESDTDDVFLSEYVEEDEDESMPDKSTSPRTTSTLISNQFLAALPFQRVRTNQNQIITLVNYHISLISSKAEIIVVGWTQWTTSPCGDRFMGGMYCRALSPTWRLRNKMWSIPER